MIGMPFLRVYYHRLYISSEGLDINTLGGLLGHLGTGLMNVFDSTDWFSRDVKSISARLRHLVLMEIFESA